MITIHQRYKRTDGQTDRRHAIPRPRICTKVHCAVKTIKVSKMASQCADTKQVMKKNHKIEMRKREEMGFATIKIEGDGTVVTWNGGLFHRRAGAIGNALLPTVDSRVRRTAIDDAECNRCLASVSYLPTYWRVPIRRTAEDTEPSRSALRSISDK